MSDRASLALLASLALASAPAALGDCANDAGSGDIAEGEPCLLDLATNHTDEGCNLTPILFHEIPDAELADGQVTICGTASNYNLVDTCDTNADCADGNCQGDPNPGDGNPQGTCVGPSEPSSNRRDTDWHRISASALAAADADGNGVVQITSHVVSEFDAVTFFISIGDPVCSPFLVLNAVGCFDAGPNTSIDAVETVTVADHPNGVVAFVAPGMCNGAGIFDGYECGDVPALNDYVVTLTFGEPPTACGDPDTNPNLGPCELANPGVAGCDDPECCKAVCAEFSPLCCSVGWSRQCADAAVSLGCAPPCCDGPVCPSTGADGAADGFLQVCADPMGGWAHYTFGGASDRYNPVGEAAMHYVSFSNAFFLYRPAQQQRELLSNNPMWKRQLGVDDASLSAVILCVNPGPNCIPGSVASDTNDDGVYDHVVSKFRVTGTGVDLTFDLTQQVSIVAPRAGDPVSVLNQTYSIHNNLASEVSFTLLRQADLNLTWDNGADNDSVGTGTNGSPLDRHVFVGEAGQPATHITMSSPQATRYVGAKSGVDPDGPGPGPAMGAGTDVQEWNVYGVPEGWGNFIAYVGYDTNGSSGATAGDAHVDLEIPVSIAGNGTTVVNVDVTYGAMTPLGQHAPCPWDCADGDGGVDVVDFLALLAEWGMARSNCDVDGGGVGITDFLALLAAWGSCP